MKKRAAISAAVTLLLAELLHAAARADPPTQPSEINVWGQAVCNNFLGPDYPAVLTPFTPSATVLRSATTMVFSCDNYYPAELVGDQGCAYDLSIDIGGYVSADGLNTDIRHFANMQFPMLAYATKKDSVNVWWIVAAGACVEQKNLPAIVPGRALRSLQALQRFGFTVKPWPGS